MRRSKHLTVGPGGTKCNCCFPAPGSKARRMAYRRAKRLEKREAIKLETQQLVCSCVVSSYEPHSVTPQQR